MTENDKQKWLTAEDACELLKLSKSGFYVLKKMYNIKGYGVSQYAMYKYEDIEQFLYVEKPKKKSGRKPKNKKENEQ